MTKPRTPEEIAYDVWVAVHTPGNLSREVIFAALREAASKDYEDMRRFQREYIRADHERIDLRARVAELERKLAEETERREAAELDFEREHTRCEKAEAEAQWQKERGENNTLAHAAELDQLRASQLADHARALLEHVETENADVIGAVEAARLALTGRAYGDGCRDCGQVGHRDCADPARVRD